MCPPIARPDEKAEPNSATHQKCAPPFSKQQVTETGNKPGCRSNQPGRTGSWFRLFDLYAFSLNQISPPKPEAEIKVLP